MSEKLNEWTVFNEKYKELCEWLTNMESKVSQNGDISIEEMIEKLRKVNSYEQKPACQIYYLMLVKNWASVQKCSECKAYYHHLYIYFSSLFS